ncbi:hypothetical protein [Lentzea sp. NPDC092896]|uniref:hypothetical protein n=1 Tax=Lentzea sp. NPDC092896 TaxID=3364127 RepID=UPI0037FB1AC3
MSRWTKAGLLVQVDVGDSSVVHLVRTVRAKGEKRPAFTQHLRWVPDDRQLAQSEAVVRGLAELDRGESVEL